MWAHTPPDIEDCKIGQTVISYDRINGIIKEDGNITSDNATEDHYRNYVQYVFRRTYQGSSYNYSMAFIVVTDFGYLVRWGRRIMETPRTDFDIVGEAHFKKAQCAVDKAVLSMQRSIK